MVRGRGARGARGRGRRGRAGVVRAVRRAMAAPRERVRPRSVIRTRPGHGTVSWNTLRRLTVFPKKVGATGPTPATDAWWIQGLKWVGWVAMQLITILLAEESFSQHKLRHSPDSPYTAGAAVVGCVQTLLLGAEDMVASSPLSTLASSGKVFLTKFRQGRMMHLRLNLIPSASLAKRGGQWAVALLPLTLGENLDFALSPLETEKWTFDDVCRLPNAVVKSTSTPLSIVYSPKQGDLAYRWMDLGYNSFQTATKPGGNKSLRLIFAYMDMSSNSADVSEEYALTESAAELVLDGRVELREISDDRELPSVPFSTRPIDSLVVCDFGRRYLHAVEGGEWVNGVYYHHAPTGESSGPASVASSFMEA